MKLGIFLVTLLLMTTTLSSQSVKLEYDSVEVNSLDTVELANKTHVTFFERVMVIQSDNDNIYSLLAPGTEFSELKYRMFVDMNTMLEDGDSTTTIMLYQSVDVPHQIGIVMDNDIQEHIKIIKTDGTSLILKN